MTAHTARRSLVFLALVFACFGTRPARAEVLVRVSLGVFPSVSIRHAGREVRLTSRSALPAVFGPDTEPVRVNRRLYRGRIRVTRVRGAKVSVENVVGLEDYLRGVVPSEMPSAWPREALKAQAVAARTYALWRMGFGTGARPAGDVVLAATVSDQVYRGMSAERDTTNEAVDGTAGEALTVNGRILPAYFHAACGGMTERASSAWPATARRLADDTAWQDADRIVFQPLPDADCRTSPHSAWRVAVPARTVARIAGLERLAAIEIVDRDESGRASSFRVSGRARRGGAAVRSFDGPRLRMTLGPDRLKSLLCEVELSGASVVFTGRGWGHGVGLCQWGARGMAESGFGYRQILEKYYPGAIVSPAGFAAP